MTGPRDFDAFVEEHNIQPEEMGAAFAAWLNGATGWDGDVSEVDLPPGQNGPTADYGDEAQDETS